MWSVFLGILILIPVVGSLLYAFFAFDERRERRTNRFTAFGETPEDTARR
jgi:UPF0716 family protein affecting phage T7 exclusion